MKGKAITPIAKKNYEKISKCNQKKRNQGNYG